MTVAGGERLLMDGERGTRMAVAEVSLPVDAAFAGQPNVKARGKRTSGRGLEHPGTQGRMARTKIQRGTNLECGRGGFGKKGAECRRQPVGRISGDDRKRTKAPGKKRSRTTTEAGNEWVREGDMNLDRG